MKRSSKILVSILLLSLLATSAATADPLQLERDDRISILGNTLAERMQHDGWLEAFWQARFPEHRLVFRNLGFSGDELTERIRSRDFGSPDDWLRFNKTDILLAFFGYNESFAGQAGLAQFRKDLNEFIDSTRSQKYNGEDHPQLILFSPIAHEDLNDPNLPSGEENNRRLALYTQAMAEVAKASGVRFVDLFQPTLELYERTDEPLTINGIHLNEQGNRQIASIIERALFEREPAAAHDSTRMEEIREAVLEKNFYWFNRYRTVDGYSIYGGRADLEFVDGQTNREVMQREMEVLDVMTANRDQRIWAAAQGDSLEVDDSNTPPFIPVETNKPGELPGGKHRFLGGEEAIDEMTVAEGMKVELFASEEMFPELVNPVQMAFDTQGRLWVAAWTTYPHWKPKTEMNDKLLILEDTDSDGRADVCKTFADGLHNPTGFEFYQGGVIVAHAPDLLYLADTDGDDRADVRQRVLHGIDSADTHHTANSFVFGPGGALFFQEGTFHHTQVETPWGPPVRSANAAVFRYEPRTHKFGVYVPYGFANPHGHVFDRWGQDIVHDGTGAIPYHAALFSGHTEFPRKHPRPPTVYKQRTRPCPATEILSSRHFPDENQGNLLVGNVIGFQGILQYELHDDKSSFSATEVEPILQSSDPNFRPVDLEIGADGALYFVDWQNPIIGHMQHNLRDPSRDQAHGRVYRVTCPDRRLMQPAAIADQPIETLLELLKEPENRVRYRAKIELGARDTAEVMEALERWMASLDESNANHERYLLEALWLHQYHNVVNEALLKRMLDSPQFRARAAATRVLCYWRDRVSDSLQLLKRLAADDHPRVRLEAVRAASFFEVPEAVEVPLIAAELPTDQYLDYVHSETMTTLEPYWEEAIAEGREIALTSDAGRRFLLRSVSTEQLLEMPRDRGVLLELLYRSGLQDEQRREALSGLARREDKSELQVLLEAIENLEEKRQDESVVYDLVRLLTAHSPQELATVRLRLQQMATRATLPVVRQIGYVALISADEDVERAWEMASESARRLDDLVNAMPLIPDPSVRARVYPKVAPLLDGLPEGVASSDQQRDGEDVEGAIRRAAMKALTYVRGKETETFDTLAEFIRKDIDRPAAIWAIQRVPRRYWPEEEAKPLLEGVLAYVRQMPVKERNSPEALDALQLGDSLAALLPAEEAREARAELGELGLRVIRLGTLPHRMSYDRQRIAVRAGKPVQFVLENPDIMPHNFVITEPGALEEIGMEAEATAQQPGAAKRNYVPESDRILLSSRLLQPRDQQTLTFTAPSEPGVYPYVCTYPGHWRRMYGALYVVEDLEEYLADAESYLAAHDLPIQDKLLKFNRPRKEWKFEELASSVREMQHGRSYGNAKQIFEVANCVACHKLNGAGNEIGPELEKLDAEFTRVDILQELLEPSKRINEDFRTYVFELDSGRIVSGLILEETPEVVKVIKDPLANEDPVVVQKSEIAVQQKSPNSIMPNGLLDKLTRDEILDLIAYVAARGRRDHPLFEQEHDH